MVIAPALDAADKEKPDPKLKTQVLHREIKGDGVGEQIRIEVQGSVALPAKEKPPLPSREKPAVLGGVAVGAGTVGVAGTDVGVAGTGVRVAEGAGGGLVGEGGATVGDTAVWVAAGRVAVAAGVVGLAAGAVGEAAAAFTISIESARKAVGATPLYSWMAKPLIDWTAPNAASGML